LISTFTPATVLVAPVLGTVLGTAAVRRTCGVHAGGVAASMMFLIGNIVVWNLAIHPIVVRIAAAIGAADLGLLFTASYLRCRSWS
jgi:hypothetical protein